jgi:hypothetical protein
MISYREACGHMGYDTVQSCRLIIETLRRNMFPPYSGFNCAGFLLKEGKRIMRKQGQLDTAFPS